MNQKEALQRLKDYFEVGEGDNEFSWPFSGGKPKALPVSELDRWSKGWGSKEEKDQWSSMLSHANPSDVSISTNHMLMVCAIRDSVKNEDANEL